MIAVSVCIPGVCTGSIPLRENARLGRSKTTGRSCAVDSRLGGIGLGGILVIVGIIVALVWSVVLGIIIALIGLIAFGGFARGKWY
jgi:hypothetical protein